LGKFEKVQFWFQKWVDEYKVQMKQHLKALPKTFAKIGDYPDLPALVPLAFLNIGATGISIFPPFFHLFFLFFFFLLSFFSYSPDIHS
jgi:hypothetical protein